MMLENYPFFISDAYQCNFSSSQLNLYGHKHNSPYTKFNIIKHKQERNDVRMQTKHILKSFQAYQVNMEMKVEMLLMKK